MSLLWSRGTEMTPVLGVESKRLSERQVTDVQLSLARSLEKQGELESAMNAYRQMIEKAPKRSTPYWRLAVLHDRQGRFHESDSLYQQALKLDRKNPEIHCDYGYNLYLQRRWAEAEEHLRQAVSIKSDNPRAHNNLGLLLAQTDRSNEAISEFRKAGCSESDLHVNLAFSAMLKHDWDNAREEYHIALRTNPESTAAKNGIEKLESLVAQADPAAGPVTLAGSSADVNRFKGVEVYPAMQTSPAHTVVPPAERADWSRATRPDALDSSYRDSGSPDRRW